MATLVLGLDGGSFHLIDRWLQTSELPNLARLCEEGAAMDMQSCPPPVTCPNWQCYATGTNPGKLGVFWWEKIDRSRQRMVSTASSGDFDGVHYWHQFDGESAIVNLPTTYPPPAIDGLHIAGGPGSDSSGYTTPPDLEREIENRHGYMVHPPSLSSLSRHDPGHVCVDEIYDLIDARFDLVSDLLAEGEYEFVHLTVFYINVLQHFFWDHEVVLEGWRRIDRRIGELLDQSALEHLFVMSDHGSNEIEITFNVNHWLEQEGYLVTKSGVSDLLYKAGLTQDRLRGLLSRLRFERTARRFVPRHLQTLLPSADGSVSEQGKQDVIDWEASTAVASGQGPVWVLTEDRQQRQAIRDQLITDLYGLRSDDGTGVVSAASPAAELYEGAHVPEGPEIVLRQAPGVHIDDRIGARKTFTTPDSWSAENTETGLCIAYGPTINPQATGLNMAITDLAPTITHLMGYPVPENMDGTVQTALFAADSPPARRTVDTRPPLKDARGTSAETTSTTEQRLSDLGYLS
jgi:predicted AlkP superfamily phosphohydrolase/phosphomutase